MRTPQLIIPRDELILPLGAPAEVDLGLLLDARPMVVDFGALQIIKLNFPFAPTWEESQDGVNGVVNIADSKTGEVMPSAAINLDKEVARLETALDKDGFTFRDNQDSLVTFGVRDTAHHFVWWCVTNIVDLEHVEPESVESINVSVAGAEYLAFHHRRVGRNAG